MTKDFTNILRLFPREQGTDSVHVDTCLRLSWLDVFLYSLNVPVPLILCDIDSRIPDAEDKTDDMPF